MGSAISRDVFQNNSSPAPVRAFDGSRTAQPSFIGGTPGTGGYDMPSIRLDHYVSSGVTAGDVRCAAGVAAGAGAGFATGAAAGARNPACDGLAHPGAKAACKSASAMGAGATGAWKAGSAVYKGPICKPGSNFGLPVGGRFSK